MRGITDSMQAEIVLRLLKSFPVRSCSRRATLTRVSRALAWRRRYAGPVVSGRDAKYAEFEIVDGLVHEIYPARNVSGGAGSSSGAGVESGQDCLPPEFRCR
jgi:hypothetical protein